MTIRATLIASSLIATSLVSGAAHAVLQGRDLNGSAGSFEAYYDTDLNITWLANANMNGKMDWATATTWAASLSFTDGVNVYGNWRLPTTLTPDASCGGTSDPDTGYNCTGSELGHLFYSELGGIVGLSIWLSADPDLVKFTNIQSYVYWSGSQNAAVTDQAWSFYMNNGFQFAEHKVDSYYAWAVSPGDVAAVPEAQTYALMLAGLGLVGWRARRRG